MTTPHPVPSGNGAEPATPPSGRQYNISHHDHSAVVTQVGATLRACTLQGVPVVDGFDVTHRATDGRGQVLAPWPNRLASGTYIFAGRHCQAPLNEPGRHDAIHGLVRWLDWGEMKHTSDRVVLGCVLRPQPGYEWQLHLRVEYRLADQGLKVTTTATNTGAEAAPFGIGFHPYLTLGSPIDGLQLTLPARTQLIPATDPDQPPTHRAVTGTPLDFRTAKPIGGARLDTAFGELQRQSDGRAIAALADPATGKAVQLWVDDSFSYLMVYSADQVRSAERRRQAVAIEPMTCPPHAFRSGTQVIALSPGETWRGAWGLSSQG